MTRVIFKIVIVLLASRFQWVRGQMDKYSYKRELTGMSKNWHKIVIPDEVFCKLSKDMNDIRIFGVISNRDTIEVPYLFNWTAEKQYFKEVEFKIINETYKDGAYFYTFEIPQPQSVNQILLNFQQLNFDWRIKLQGTENLQDWFTILDNYRILGIQNSETHFQFSKLSFPDIQYRYLRLQIASLEKPVLKSATLTQQKRAEGVQTKYEFSKYLIKNDKKKKQTEINLELKTLVPVSSIKFFVKDKWDYYRRITIEYLSDSIKTELGWKYNYTALTSAIINSNDSNEFNFDPKSIEKIRITIYNEDNEPLSIDRVEVKGNLYELIGRFSEKAKYFLVYGNREAGFPNYDLTHFADKIPTDPTALELGKEMEVKLNLKPKDVALFKNKNLLWTIMGITILVLGWFTIRMMKKIQ